MAAISTGFVSGSALALLLISLQTACASDDDSGHEGWVTTKQCSKQYTWIQLRLYPEDSEANHLVLGRCNLISISPSDVFQGLPNLETISLSGNEIVHVDTATFIPVPNLKNLWLDHNKIREPPVFVETSCPNLIILTLDKNIITGIRDVKTFSACVKLEHIYLDNNDITYIHPLTFSSLAELKEIYLRNNQITYMPEQMFINNGKLESVWLQGNRLTYLPANFITNLKHTSPKLNTLTINNNPWQCACFLEMFIEFQRFGLTRYADYDNLYKYGNRKSCVFRGAVSCSRRGRLLPQPRPATSCQH